MIRKLAGGICAVLALSAQAAGPPVQPLATLQDLMRYEVDANADPIWDAVGSIITRDGIAERQPRADAEWEEVRRHAILLLEATNLLVIPGRKVSAAPFPSDGPGVFGSADIQRRIDRHRPEFNAYALGLRAIVADEIKAIDKRDAKALQSLGESMDAACEACHVANWYPNEVVPELPPAPPPPTFSETAHQIVSPGDPALPQ